MQHHSKTARQQNSQPIELAWITFLVLGPAFLLHRLLSHGLLAQGSGSFVETTKMFVVGAMSDFWVAYLGAAACGLTAWSLHSLRLFRIRSMVLALAVVAMTLALLQHQAYTEFFRLQIAPFHLRYLTDWDFLKANAASGLRPKPLLAGASLLFNLGLLVWLRPTGTIGTNRLRLGFALLGLLALLAHNRNIAWRVQWFVPENLQMNFFERLYVASASTRVPPVLSPRQLQSVRSGSRLAAFADIDLEADEHSQLKQALWRRPPLADELDSTGQAIAQSFADLQRSGRKPLLLFVLMESLRPAESGYFADAQAHTSLTPRLDHLAARGVVFRNAYASGSVTRGGQESLFCGFPSGRDTSLMRGTGLLAFDCLTKYAKEAEYESLWLHGGEGRYDRQEDYWRSQGVERTLTVTDFAPDTPRTGWGVSDLGLVEKAKEVLAQTRQTSTSTALIALLLTVTNHIPWTLPADSPAAIKSLATDLAHPSYATTAYSDLALGKLEDFLRESGLWDLALVVVASDHGNAVPPYLDIYKADASAAWRLQAHINLVLTGGIVEKLDAPLRVQRSEYVSQADVATFAAAVLRLPQARTLSESLFVRRPSTTLTSDIEAGLFLPEQGVLIKHKDLVGEGICSQDSVLPSILRFCAFLRYQLTGRPDSPPR